MDKDVIKLVIIDGKAYASGPRSILSEEDRIQKFKKSVDKLMKALRDLKQLENPYKFKVIPGGKK